MQALLNTAIKAARKAGDIAQMNFDRINESDIETKGYNEFVTFVDKQAETAIKDVIQSRYPEHGIIAEESKPKESDGCDYVWIIDPLDGTTNYIHSFPVYAVSIALKVKGLLEVAVIYDPSRQELFTAIRGAGSQLDGRRSRVSKQTTPETIKPATGYIGQIKCSGSRSSDACSFLREFREYLQVDIQPVIFLAVRKSCAQQCAFQGSLFADPDSSPIELTTCTTDGSE